MLCFTTGQLLPATPLNTNHSIRMRDSSHNRVAAQQRNRNDSELFHCWRRADASASQHSQCPSTLAFFHMDLDQAESNIGQHLQLDILILCEQRSTAFTTPLMPGFTCLHFIEYISTTTTISFLHAPFSTWSVLTV